MSTPDRSMRTGSSVVRIEQSDEWVVAIDEDTDIASQGETRAEALSNLAEALELRRGEGVAIEDPDAFLADELDIDVAQLDEREPPWMSSLMS